MASDPHGLALQDFVEWELVQHEKHEYSGGQISAFAGGTKRHAIIASEVLGALLAGLRGQPCLVFGSDISIAMGRSVRYADVVVTDDTRDLANLGETTLRYPRLIVEVLSSSTAATDRGVKLEEYRTIDTLAEYVLIDSRRRWIESYRRGADGWIARLPVRDGEFRFDSVNVTIAIDALYRQCDIAPSQGE